MSEGQEVICISEDFPMKITTDVNKEDIGKQAKYHPKLNEPLIIDETLGEYLSFSKYNINGVNWWHSSRFRLVKYNESEELTGTEIFDNTYI